MAHMGLDSGQLNAQNFADLRIALIGADQPEHLKLHGGQRLTGGKLGLKVVGIIGGLHPGCGDQGAEKRFVPFPAALLQQRKHCGAIEAYRTNKAKFKCDIKAGRQVLFPLGVLLTIPGNGCQEPQVDRIDVPIAGGKIGFQRRKGQQGGIGGLPGPAHTWPL